jgi:hypothetical protein
MLLQVIDAKEDSRDCQREHQSRKLAALSLIEEFSSQHKLSD